MPFGADGIEEELEALELEDEEVDDFVGYEPLVQQFLEDLVGPGA